MKNTLLLLALLPAIALSSAKAQTANPLFHHIPADADQVYHINLATLNPKVDWQALSSLMKGRNLGKTKLPFDIMKALNSGVDPHQDLIITRSNVYNIDSAKYTTFLVHLTDSAKFIDFLRSMGHELHFHHMPGHERVATLTRESFAWNDKLAVVVVATVPMLGNATQPTEQHLARKAVAALHGSEHSFFTTDTRFTTAFSNDADMQVWNRHSANLSMMNKMLAGNPGAAKLGGIMQMLSRSSAAPTIGTLRFQPGKISFDIVKFVSPGELSGLQHLIGQGLGSDMIAAVPSGRLMGMMAIHYNLKALLDSIRHLLPMDSLNSMLAKKGLTLQDFTGAMKGDFMLLAYNPDKDATGPAAAKPGIFAMLSIADRSAFARITHGLNIPDAATPADTSVADTSHHGPKIFYSLHNDIAVIGGDRRQVNDFFNHPAEGTNPTQRLLLDPSQPKMFSLGLDMHSVTDFLTPMLTKGDTIAAKNQALLDAFHQMDVVLVSGGIVDGTLESEFQLRMTDKDRNGLSTFIDILGKLSPKPSGNNAQ